MTGGRVAVLHLGAESEESAELICVGTGAILVPTVILAEPNSYAQRAQLIESANGLRGLVLRERNKRRWQSPRTT